MKKWLLPKIVASIALLWILIGILWTAFLYILSPKQEINTKDEKEVKLTPDQMKQLQELTWSWSEK